MQAVILAGGRGRRLLPYTTVLPKPLMPIGEYPILEVILRQLERSGFDDIVISTGYLAELIHAFLANRRENGARIRYSHEGEPLGTIGPLHLIESLEDTFLVMNGDILTDMDYTAMLREHRKRGGIATIATYQRDVKIDFGVLEHDAEQRIRTFREKPLFHFAVSMGIYVFQKEILEHVPRGKPFGFDDLMYTLIAEHAVVFAYPYAGKWLDIGRPDDYEQSIEEFERNRQMYLK
jgi:NDP-sugar pyrophosphorylase family protein